MGLSELACRSRQAASKHLERVAGVGSRNHHVDTAGDILLDRFRRTALNRFFDGAAGAETPKLLRDEMPAACDEVIASAEAVSQGVFDLLGYRGLSFGDPVDWHLDPISRRRAPRLHWSRLDPLDSDVVGDCKVIWELNRHQWLVRLGQAYVVTEDERYARVFAGYIRDWIRANPRGIGINWTSSLEIALRLISWCWALALFRKSDALTPELFLEVLQELSAHASHVERYLSHYSSPNTHLTGEALALFYAGAVFPELRAAGRWRELGARILVEQSVRQILPDGVYFEQTTCYQRYTAEIYLHFLILAAKHGIAVPTVVQERVQRLLDVLLALRRPDGSMPQIGDADGGWLLPLATRSPDELRPIFSTAAALFRDASYAWAAGGLQPETVWLLGPASVRTFEGPVSAPSGMPGSRLLAEGGYAVMRSGWERDAHHVIVDVGPLGCPVSGGHGHADLLSIQCAAFGEPYLVDPGTYSYRTDAGWRDFFRSTAAHSTVMIDGMGHAAPGGPFAWQTRPQGRVRRWLSTDTFDLVDADHDAYCGLPDPVVHRRRVLFVKPRYWVVVDDIEGTAEHRVELRFQFAPVEVTLEPAPWVRAGGRGGHALLLRAFATVPLKVEVLEGEPAPIQGWVSPDYGQRRPAPVLIHSLVTRLPLRVLTLLYPMEDPLAAPPAVSLVTDEGSAPMGLVFDEARECVRFSDRDVVVEQRGVWA
jgi:hypothetical protein